MPADNVTPFRRPPKRAPAPQQERGLGFKTHRGKAVLVQGLTIAAFACAWFLPGPYLSLIGVAVGVGGALLAFTNRGQSNPWANTHHEHALRTLIFGFVFWMLGSALGYVHGALAVATIYVHLAVAVWGGLRGVIGLVLAMMRKPVPNPRGLLA